MPIKMDCQINEDTKKAERNSVSEQVPMSKLLRELCNSLLHIFTTDGHENKIFNIWLTELIESLKRCVLALLISITRKYDKLKTELMNL